MKFLIARRLSQVIILILFIISNTFGIKFLQGNLSASLFADTIPLSDPYALLQMFVAGASISFNAFTGALIVAIFYALLGGRLFCSWVCPINIVSDAANFLRRKLNFVQVQKPFYLNRSLRYWILGMSLVLSFLMGLTAFELISPISMLHRGAIFGMGFGLTAVAIIFLFDLIIHENGWCGYICPLGAFYALIGKFSFLRVKFSANKCSHCLKCKVVCPENEVLFMVPKFSATITKGACTNCARCIEVCEDDALNFGIRAYVKADANLSDTKNR